MIPMLIGITLLTYLTISFLPGGPAAGITTNLNPKMSPEIKQRLKEQFNFDKPFHVQYGIWIKNALKLDFGKSMKDNRPVFEKIMERIPRTVLLNVLALILAFCLAIPIGIVSAIHQNSWLDKGLTLFVFLGFSIPGYAFALWLIIFFGIYLGWLPITGFQSILADQMTTAQKIWDIAKHLILPVMVSGLTSLAGLSRYMRNGMLDVIRQDYIRAARAKGLSEKKIIYVHALKNTIIPIVTIVGLSIPGLISAGVIFETIFSYPGLGRLAYDAVVSRDIPVMMATVTFGAFLTLLGNLIADISYAYCDPRIRIK